MYGAIIGDVVGSRFEFNNIRSKDFEFLHSDCEPTDDSIMTIAIADAILEWDKLGRPSYHDLALYATRAMRLWGNAYPFAGYGENFSNWLENDKMGPYDSCGNGAAMRISPVGWAARSFDECIKMSYVVTAVSHSHFDGIMGATATAVQIFLAKQGKSLKELEQFEKEHYYNYTFDLSNLLKDYRWSSICSGTCPPAFQCLYESTDFEDAIRNCIAIGGDCDTTGAICGSIAEAVYGVPENLKFSVRTFLDEDQLRVVDMFTNTFMKNNRVLCNTYM